MLISTNHQSRSASIFSALLFILVLILLAMWLALRALAALPAPPVAITLGVQEFSKGVSEPVKLTNAGDSRLFVVERKGAIRIIQPDGALLATPFLDIQDRVNSSGSERGLLGLAFEPDNPTIFYINYTLKLSDPNDTRNGNTIIARYRITDTDPNIANPNSEEVILEVAQPYTNHNAGDLAFGPDKLLYIPLGDGGSGGDPDGNGQNLSQLLGKLLRLDVIGKSTYEIPAGNPYADDGDPNTRAEIWASGLRNPWRFSFDRQTHDIYIGDVGQGAWEEIDFQASDSVGGENYGWNCYEGNHDYESAGCSAAYTYPIFEYPRAENENNPPAPCSSITGGFVYRGPTYPNLQGHYILADYCSGKFWSLIRNDQSEWIATAQGKLIGNPSTFGEDFRGDLYVASLGGTIYRIIDPLAPPPTPTAVPIVPTIPANLSERLYLPIVGKDGTN